MSSSRSSMSPIPFKSKKPVQSTSKMKPQNTISTQTPEKQLNPLPSRLRNRGVALSLKEIRKVAAQGTRDGPTGNETDRIVKSARRQIATWPEESISAQPKKPRKAVDDGLTELPVKYKILGEYFDGLDSSIRLLRLKGSSSTFTNICPKIESLTDRRFSYQHLAQLKYILPEAIELKRINIFDERTSCMKPDLHITLNVEAIECDGKSKSESNNIYLRKVFRARLADFYKAHPEADGVPEELLPDPFNRSKQVMSFVTPPISSSPPMASVDEHVGQSPSSSLPMESVTFENKEPAVASHFSRSFQRHFSKKVAYTDPENSQLNSVIDCSQQPVIPASKQNFNEVSTCEETSSKATDCKNSSSCASSAAVAIPSLPATPIKQIDPMKGMDNPATITSNVKSTPVKLVSTPAKLMSSTPTLQPPKRCYMSPNECNNSPNKLVRRPPLTRSLKFDTPTKNVENGLKEMGDDSVDDDILNIIPENLLQSIREKERKGKEEADPAISQAKRRRQMIASLPKLFNMIHFFFQSIKRSVITKEELIHKIIAGHSDIIDRREVEEQLKLLLELVPEWISEKLASGGDLLYCINKMSSPETIRACLEEAK